MMVGLKFNLTPYSLNRIEIAGLSLPPDWTTGTGNSPPARKLACWPSIATRLGSARDRTAPEVLKTRNIAAVLMVLLNRNRFNAGDNALVSMLPADVIVASERLLGPLPLLI